MAALQEKAQCPDTGAWQLLDDANVSHIGSWAQVWDKSERASRMHPAVLFFETNDSATSWQVLEDSISPALESARGSP